jgi:hypothetical protein
MKELLKIEWLKLKSYRAFWIMVGLYLAILFSIIIGLPSFLDFLAQKTNDNVYIKASTSPTSGKISPMWLAGAGR